MTKIYIVLICLFLVSCSRSEKKLPTSYVCSTPAGMIQTDTEETKVTYNDGILTLETPSKVLKVSFSNCVSVEDK